jgi:hypothetical protein
METTALPVDLSMNDLIYKIEHSGQTHGFPPMPPGYTDIKKRRMARKVVTKCLERARKEAWEYLQLMIERESLGILKKILDGGPELEIFGRCGNGRGHSTTTVSAA